MKKPLLVAGLLLAACSASAQNNVIKANIFSPFVATGSFFYEHKLNASSSMQLGAYYTNWDVESTGLSFTGFGVTPEYRFYLSNTKEAMRGFYVGPFLRYQNLELKVGDTSGSSSEGRAELNTFGGGVVVGHQWIFRERFSIDTFLGPSYNGGSIVVKDGSGNSETFDSGRPFIGFGLRTGATLGFAF